MASNRDEVLIVDLLFLVRELGEAAVRLVEFRFVQVEPEFRETGRQRVPARMLSQYYVVRGNTDGLGRHYLVAKRVAQDAVLMDSGLMGEGVAPDDRLVGLHAKADHRC